MSATEKREQSLRCQVCKSTGSLFAVHLGQRQWCDCPACGGSGAIVLFGSATIPLGTKQSGMLKPLSQSDQRFLQTGERR